jgi:hypothetical protein
MRAAERDQAVVQGRSGARQVRGPHAEPIADRGPGHSPGGVVQTKACREGRRKRHCQRARSRVQREPAFPKLPTRTSCVLLRPSPCRGGTTGDNRHSGAHYSHDCEWSASGRALRYDLGWMGPSRCAGPGRTVSVSSERGWENGGSPCRSPLKVDPDRRMHMRTCRTRET